MISSNEFFLLGFSSIRILIENIDRISYELRKNGGSSHYYYVIKDKRGKEFTLRYSLLDGITFQELLRDLIKLNPKIVLTEWLEEFLSCDINEKKIKFDFQVHERMLFSQGKKFNQQYPSLGLFFIAIVFLVFPIPFLLGGGGDYLLTQRFGDSYHLYRICSIVIGGFAFMMAIANLLFSLISMYRGHKFTTISLAITIIGLLIGFL